jgi:hypothetical protein
MIAPGIWRLHGKIRSTSAVRLATAPLARLYGQIPRPIDSRRGVSRADCSG